MASSSKRARLDTLASLKPLSLSDSEFGRLIRSFKENSHFLASSSNSQTDVRRSLGERFHAIAETCKQVIPLQSEAGNVMRWQIQSPGKLFQHFYERLPGFRNLVQHSKSISSTWHIVFYGDEITPGNVLRPSNRRRVYCFYFTFKEFRQHIRDERCWLPLAVLRHSVVEQLRGGLSQAVKLLVASFFNGPVNFSSGVELDGCTSALKAELSNILGDEAALKSIWSSKGAAGMKPCMCCKNVISKNTSIMGYVDATYFVTVEHTRVADFDLNSNEEIWAMADDLALQNRVLNKQAFEQLQMCMGLLYNPDGLLADANLRAHVRPISCHTWDFMHTYLQGGVAAVEVHLFLDACRQKLGVRFSDVAGLCKAAWEVSDPRIKGHLANVFSDDRKSCTHDTFKGSASELLSVLPMLAHFAELTCSTRPAISKELASFFAVVEVVRSISRFLPKHASFVELVCSFAYTWHIPKNKRKKQF